MKEANTAHGNGPPVCFRSRRIQLHTPIFGGLFHRGFSASSIGRNRRELRKKRAFMAMLVLLILVLASAWWFVRRSRVAPSAIAPTLENPLQLR